MVPFWINPFVFMKALSHLKKILFIFYFALFQYNYISFLIIISCHGFFHTFIAIIAFLLTVVLFLKQFHRYIMHTDCSHSHPVSSSYHSCLPPVPYKPLSYINVYSFCL